MDYVNREKGFYNNGTSSLPMPCSYTFEENKLHIFLNGLDEQKISWSLKELSSAEPNGSSFLFTNKNMASLMGTGPLAKVVFDAFQEQLRLR
ncbi:MAG: hypothetical protein MUF75_09005 [Bacteroidia bacterium]|nr:hypothetical protein [Bacteroidia bacterium]